MRVVDAQILPQHVGVALTFVGVDAGVDRVEPGPADAQRLGVDRVDLGGGEGTAQNREAVARVLGHEGLVGAVVENEGRR